MCYLGKLGGSRVGCYMCELLSFCVCLCIYVCVRLHSWLPCALGLVTAKLGMIACDCAIV